MKQLVGIGLLAAGLMSVQAEDGAPEAKPEVRSAAAVKTLNAEKQVTLLYVKGMT
ncbi:MAG: hypothetical protein H8E27_08590 [Verrucomicrobia subdivision 3 bacterium]|nr:hypothetical protein [Limisphaerales bacterium]